MDAVSREKQPPAVVNKHRANVSREDSGHSDHSESSRSTLESSTNTPDKEKPQPTTPTLAKMAEMRKQDQEERKTDSGCDGLRSSEEKEIVALTSNRPLPSEKLPLRSGSQDSQESQTKRNEKVEQGSFDSEKKRVRKTPIVPPKTSAFGSGADHRSLPSLSDW